MANERAPTLRLPRSVDTTWAAAPTRALPSSCSSEDRRLRYWDAATRGSWNPAQRPFAHSHSAPSSPSSNPSTPTRASCEHSPSALFTVRSEPTPCAGASPSSPDGRSVEPNGVEHFLSSTPPSTLPSHPSSSGAPSHPQPSVPAGPAAQLGSNRQLPHRPPSSENIFQWAARARMSAKRSPPRLTTAASI